MKKFVAWLRSLPCKGSALAVAAVAALTGSARAEGTSNLDTTAFDSAVTSFTSDLNTLVGKMAPAIVTIATITLVIVAVNWLVRKVRGAIGRG